MHIYTIQGRQSSSWKSSSLQNTEDQNLNSAFLCVFNLIKCLLFCCSYEVIQANQEVRWLPATEEPHQETSIMGFQVSKIIGPSKAGSASSLWDNPISKWWALHSSEQAPNAGAWLNAVRKRCMILLWFLRSNPESLLILLLTAQRTKSFHRISRFVPKHSQRILVCFFFQCIIKTHFVRRQESAIFYYGKLFSKTFLPVLLAVTFLLPWHHKGKAREAELTITTVQTVIPHCCNCPSITILLLFAPGIKKRILDISIC